jgi:hypothetical protein
MDASVLRRPPAVVSLAQQVGNRRSAKAELLSDFDVCPAFRAKISRGLFFFHGYAVKITSLLPSSAAPYLPVHTLTLDFSYRRKPDAHQWICISAKVRKKANFSQK